NGFAVHSPETDVPEGKSAVVVDPDGRRVELFQQVYTEAERSHRPSRPLRRVTLEYDDGVTMLEGSAAAHWMDAINNRIGFLTFHAGFGPFPEFDWIRVSGQQEQAKIDGD